MATQNVGSFLNPPHLGFSPASAGLATALTMTFSTSLSLLEYDSFLLELPGFKSTTTSPFSVVANSVKQTTFSGDSETNAGPTFTAFWTPGCTESILAVNSLNAPGLTLILGPEQQVAAGEVVSVTIPAAAGIRLPLDGVQFNEENILVSINSADGTILPTSLLDMAVGVLWNVSTTFEPLVLGHKLNINISFVNGMDLAPGDVIDFSLTDFTGNSFRDISVSTFPSQFISSASWVVGTSQLSLSVNNSVNKGTSLSMRITNSSINLPSTGIGPSRTDLRISCQCKYGAVDNFLFGTTQSVGAFITSGFYIPPYFRLAGESAAVQISFSPVMPMNIGEVVVVQMPGFSIPDASCKAADIEVGLFSSIGGTNKCSVESDECDFCNKITTGLWDPASSELTLIVFSPISAEEQVYFEVSVDVGFQIPASGLPFMDPAFRISTNAQAGPVLPTPLASITDIGAFLGLSFQYNEQAAYADLAMKFEFTAAMRIPRNGSGYGIYHSILELQRVYNPTGAKRHTCNVNCDGDCRKIC